ncbi:hypothetical protein PAXRUDRAFT_162530 [Paxillus rubicundulus Ve08.2h10]|uniref:Uncharacterized protein n=1 Tax=Paxillus rubicundulus Ve08.2h10 TaxID=930991 RepID=A0A0D0CU97_9AGAM|nr:hypothetical protein PAXRUDRAFT_162530 [Paxillus rubicundulus Ve08.2h10]
MPLDVGKRFSANLCRRCGRLVCRISMTCQNLSTIVLPLEPKASNSKIDSTQSMPGPSNPILAANILTAPQSFAMDITDVDPLPSQINPSVKAQEKRFSRCSCTLKSKWSGHVLIYFGKPYLHARCVTLMHSPSYAHDIAQEWPHLQKDSCMDPVTENCFTDTLARQIKYQATPKPHNTDYKEGLNDLIKRAIEDYQQMLSVACKCHRSVLGWQKRLVKESQILQMEWKKYTMYCTISTLGLSIC